MRIAKVSGRLALCALLLGVSPFFATPASAALIVVGTPKVDSGNRYPFGNGYSGLYQQVYSASVFQGPVTIAGLEFYNTQVDSGVTAIESGHYGISFSTTSADRTTLDSSFVNNPGGTTTVVYSGSLAQPWAFGNTLRIGFTTPFAYDPALGNLLMTVNVTNSTGDHIYFDWESPSASMGRVYGVPWSTSSGRTAETGLVTGFQTVPEPATILLLGSGVIGVGIRQRRRRL